VAGGIGVDEPLHAEPTHDTPAHLLGERGQIGLGDRPGRQLSTAGSLPAGGPAARHRSSPNMPYWAIGLADPTSVVATSSGHNRDSYPKRSQIEFEFPATDKRGAVKVCWYDGVKLPTNRKSPARRSHETPRR
jgi:hypothetical protein